MIRENRLATTILDEITRATLTNGSAVIRYVDRDRSEGVIESTEDARRLARALVRVRACSPDERTRRFQVAERLGCRTIRLSTRREAVKTAAEATHAALRSMVVRGGSANAAFRSSHPNVSPAVVVVVDDESCVVVSVEPTNAHTLGVCLRSGFGAFDDADRKSLAALQLCRGVAHCHERQLALGNLSVDETSVSTLSGGARGTPYVQVTGMYNSPHARAVGVGGSRTFEVSAESALRVGENSDIRNITAAWRVGAIGNLEYVLKLNEIARRDKDRSHHTFAPWVIDFSEFPLNADGSLNGLRDLTKTKFRLTKGDEQLDFTYRNTTPPHHVSGDCLSELGVCIALARRTPRATLAHVVRANVVADEYPKDLSRLYQVLPDEAPIEFYVDPLVFKSIHEEMSDLALPTWARVGEDSASYFIKVHREAFESCVVSENLHSWIDLTFGYATYGTAAIDAKNVMVPDSDRTLPSLGGRLCLFHAPHPKRSVGIVPRSLSPRSGSESDALALATTMSTMFITEPPLSVAQDDDLRALGRILGAIYAGAPCPEFESAAPSNGLFDESPMKSVSESLFEDRKVHAKMAFKSYKAWLSRMPVEARDVVKLLMDSAKPIAAAAVRDSVLFSQDIRSAATILGNMRSAYESIAARIMVAEAGLKGASNTVSRFVLEDLCPEIEEYIVAPFSETQEMQLAMSFSLFVQTACDVASRRDIINTLFPLFVHALSAPNSRNVEGPTLKREMFHLNVLRCIRRSIGAATFNRVMIPVFIACLQPKFRCSAEEIERVTQALVYVARTTPLPIVLRRIVDVLHKALKNNRDDTSSGAHVIVADVLTSISEHLGPRAEELILRTSIGAPSSILENLDDWHPQSPATGSRKSEWSWLPRVSPFDRDDGIDDDELTMSQVLANAGAVDDEPWRLHVEALTSWRAHSQLVRPSAQALDVSADERLFLTHGATSKCDGVVCVWRASGPGGDEEGAMTKYNGHAKATVTASAFLNFARDREGDVSRACSCDDKGYIQVWNTSGAHVWQFYARDSDGFQSLHASDARGEHVIGGTTKGKVLIADACAGRVVRQFSCPNSRSVSALYVSSAGLICASNQDGYMYGFDSRASDENVFEVKAHDSGINKIISASNEPHELLTASSDMTVGLWDMRMIDGGRDAKRRYDGRLRTFRGHQREVRDIAVSAKGDVFSVSGTSIGIFSLNSSTERFTRFAPLSVHGVSTPSAPKSGAEQSAFSAIQLLPSSRLFALLNEDGLLSVCH